MERPANLEISAFSALPYPKPLEAGFETYLSPFTYRYGTPEMRKIWSQQQFWRNVRSVMLSVAETQYEADVTGITQDHIDDLRIHFGDLSVERIFQIERDRQYGIEHDFAACIAEWSEWAPIGGRILGKGMTSEDGLSNAEIMQIRDSIQLLRPKLVSTLVVLGEQVERHKGLACMAYTHLQAAEPTITGYRFASWAQDLLEDLHDFDGTAARLKSKGIKGAVGTAATFTRMLEGKNMSFGEFENRIMARLGLQAATITAQTYPRKSLLKVGSVLSGIGESLHRAALNIQLLQGSTINEVVEPRRKGQIGSNAMPHKQNPIISENIDALTEMLPGQNFAAWMTSAFETLERTLRDSAGKRSWLPESFLVVDEALTRAEKVFAGLQVSPEAAAANLRKFGPYCASEIIMDALNSTGMDRKTAHAILVEHAEVAHDAVRHGKQNPMRRLLLGDERITAVLGRKAVSRAFRDIYSHTGEAGAFCDKFLQEELYPAIGK